MEQLQRKLRYIRAALKSWCDLFFKFTLRYIRVPMLVDSIPVAIPDLFIFMCGDVCIHEIYPRLYAQAS